MHPAERARDFRELVPTPQPGSIAEAEALSAIDERRHNEVNPPTRRRQRRALAAHWSDRDNAVG